MYHAAKAACSCKGDCDCNCSTRTNMASSESTHKDDTGLTDVEDNQQSEGEGRKRSHSGSPIRARKNKPPGGDAAHLPKRAPTQQNNQSRRNVACSSSLKPVDHQKETGRSLLLEPQELHVLRPHSNRRHYNHHLLDHFSSGEIHRSREKHHRRKVHHDIIPTLESCEYKDTNFFTEGSPPRTPSLRRYMTSRTLAITEEMRQKEFPASRKKTAHVAAGFWKEPPDHLVAAESSSSSQESEDLTSENNRSSSYLNKYKNESVRGPVQRSTANGCPGSRFPKSGASSSSEKLVSAHGSESYMKPKLEAACSRQLSSSLKRLPGNRKSTPRKPTRRGKSTKKESYTRDSSIFTSCIPAVTALRSSTKQSAKNYPKSSICQSCLERKELQQDASTQTDVRDGEEQNHQESQTDSVEDEERKLLEKPLMTDPSLYAVPPCLESSESNSFSTEDTASCVTFEDDDFTNFPGIGERKSEEYSRAEILHRVVAVQENIQRLRKEVMGNFGQNVENGGDCLTAEVFTELKEIISDLYELYDNFDTDEKEEQSELNEMRKQLQQYKRRCRVLEYELMSVDTKPAESGQITDLQEEVRLCRHVAVTLHWELQSADERLKKIDSENDQFRLKLISSEIQKAVLEQEMTSLRNTVDQMSLHASSFSPKENTTAKSRDTVQELQRQIQFQEEEKKAILIKLVETDKEKSLTGEQLQKYVDKYGEISLEDRSLTEEEKKNNDLKIRIRMAEDQARMLGRRVMELEVEKQDLATKLGEKTVSSTPDKPPRHSLSDIQFLEDEVEMLRITLEEAEEENASLRFELNQARERLLQDEKRIQTFQATQTSLKSLETPTISDKIAAWHVSDGTSPVTNIPDDFSTCELDGVPVLTAIDASTQTYAEFPQSLPLSSREEIAAKPSEVSKDLMKILKRSQDVDVEFIVSQLTNLAIATRQLVDETPSSTSVTFHSTEELHGVGLAGDLPEATSNAETPSSTAQDFDENISDTSTTPTITNFRLFLLIIFIYIIITSLPVMSLLQIIFLTILFCMD